MALLVMVLFFRKHDVARISGETITMPEATPFISSAPAATPTPIAEPTPAAPDPTAIPKNTDKANDGNTPNLESSKDLVAVPNVIGMTEEKAREAMTNAGFVVMGFGDESSDKVGYYEVCRILLQSNHKTVNPGDVLPCGTKLIMNRNTEDTKEDASDTSADNLDWSIMPNMIGTTMKGNLWESMKTHFSSFTVYKEYNSEYPSGQIFMTEPEAGGHIYGIPSFWVSLGSEPTEEDMLTVPDVSGMSKAEAKAALEKAGFTVRFGEEYSDTVSKGNVISQNNTPGAKVDKRTEGGCYVVISKGPKV